MKKGSDLRTERGETEMDGVLTLMANPAKKKGKKKYKKYKHYSKSVTLRSNPAKSASFTSPQNILEKAVPLTGGIVGSLYLPRALNMSTGFQRYLPGAGLAFVAQMAKGTIGHNFANLITLGAIGGLALMLADDLIFKKQGYPLTSDSLADMVVDNTVQQGSDEVQVVSQNVPELEVMGDEEILNAEGEELSEEEPVF